MMLCDRYPSDRCKVVHNIAISQLCQQALLNSRRTTTPRLLVVLGVTVTTSWQPDRLAQRELFDEKTRRVVPDYYEIWVDGFDGHDYGYWPAKKFRQHVELDRSSRSAHEDTKLFHLLPKSIWALPTNPFALTKWLRISISEAESMFSLKHVLTIGQPSLQIKTTTNHRFDDSIVHQNHLSDARQDYSKSS